MGASRNRATGMGDPGPTVEDLYPSEKWVREADIPEAKVGMEVTWNGYPGKVKAIDGRKVTVELNEAINEAGDRVITVNKDRLRLPGGQRMDDPETVESATKTLASSAKRIALAIHAKIQRAEALKEEYRRMVKVCELLGVSLDELPALSTAHPRRKGVPVWSAEQRRAASDRMTRMNAQRREREAQV